MYAINGHQPFVEALLHPQVFNHLCRSDYLHWSVSASYVEIYNENFRDLTDLTKPSDITIYEQQ